jgi:hypothetical protein
MPEVYDMVPVGTEAQPKPEVYQMVPVGTEALPKPEVYDMVPIGQPTIPTTIPEGHVYTWVLYTAVQWNGGFCTTTWTATPGDYTGYGGLMTVSNPQYTHVKIVGYGGADGYWLTHDSFNMGSGGLKTALAYGRLGSGSAQASTALAKADWLAGETILQLGGDNKLAIGWNDVSGSKTCICYIYIGY